MNPAPAAAATAGAAPAEQRLQVDGTEVCIRGQGPTLLLLHGWPDTLALWDGAVAALSERYRCVRFTLPGYAAGSQQGLLDPPPVAWIVEHIRRVADAASPGAPLTLLLHDWGCFFGYEFAARHPDRVQRIVGVDVGDHNSAALARALKPGQKFGVLAYQSWLAAAWWIARRLSRTRGQQLTLTMLDRMRYPGDRSAVHVGMNYPYAMRWLGVAGGLGGTAPVADLAPPMLYVYGRRKPFMFHSPQWLDALRARPGCAVAEFRTGHWVMLEQPERFAATVGAWLDGRPLPEPEPAAPRTPAATAAH